MKLKILFTALIINLGVGCYAQTPENEVDYEVIENVAGSKSKLFSELRRWAALTFESSDMVDLADPEIGTMVIKWNIPVKQPSQYITMTLTGMYVIDVRDGKYRFRTMRPKLYIEPIQVIDDTFSPAEIARAQSDISFAATVAQNYFNGSREWPMGADFRKLNADITEELSQIPQYKNDKDREKAKTSPEWLEAERRWRMVNNPLKTYDSLNASMSSSLKNAMNRKDDF